MLLGPFEGACQSDREVMQCELSELAPTPYRAGGEVPRAIEGGGDGSTCGYEATDAALCAGGSVGAAFWAAGVYYASYLAITEAELLRLCRGLKRVVEQI